MKARWTKIAVVLLMAVFFGGLTAIATDEKSESAAVKKGPKIDLDDVYGNDFELADFKGKVIVLEWLNRECPISKGKHKAKVMQDMYKKFAEKGVIWLAIDSTQSHKPGNNRVYAAKMGLAYPILHDPEGKVGRAYGAKTTPHMFVIDKTGNIAYDGAIDDQGKTNYVEAALEDLLAGRPVAKPRTKPYGCSIKYAPKK